MFIEINCNGSDGEFYTIIQEQNIIEYKTHAGSLKKKITLAYSLNSSAAPVQKVADHFLARIGSEEIKLVPIKINPTAEY